MTLFKHNRSKTLNYKSEPQLLNFITTNPQKFSEFTSPSNSQIFNFTTQKVNTHKSLHSVSSALLLSNKKNQQKKSKLKIPSCNNQNNIQKIYISKISQINRSGPSRNAITITKKLLLRRNIEKFIAGDFSENSLNNKLLLEKQKTKSFLINFSNEYPKIIDKNATNVNQLFSLNKFIFKEKEKDNFEYKKQSSLIKNVSFNDNCSVVSPKERAKFSSIINFNSKQHNNNKTLMFSDYKLHLDNFKNEKFEKETEFQKNITEINHKKTNYLEKQNIYNKILNIIAKEKKEKELVFFAREQNTKKIKFRLVKERLLICLKKLSKLKLNIDHIYKISYKPYQREGSYGFLEAVKMGNNELIKSLLEKNKSFIYEYDFVHNTALHLAVKKSNFKLVKYLISKDCEINMLNSFNKSALTLAVENNDLNIVRYLLFQGANPWLQKEFENLENEKLKIYLKKAREINILYRLISDKEEKKQFWLKNRITFTSLI